jgi:hypothetical protein
MKIKSVLVTLVAGIALSGCVETAEFGGSGGSFGGSGGSGGFGGSGGSGGSSDAGERLARQVCEQAIRDEGQRVVGLYRREAVDYPYRGAGVDLYFTVRRDPMTVSESRVWCRFMYDTGRPRLTSA